MKAVNFDESKVCSVFCKLGYYVSGLSQIICSYKPEILTARYGMANSRYLLEYLTKVCSSEFTGKLKEVSGGGV